MKKIAFIIIFVGIGFHFYSQLNISDSLNTVLHRECHDTLKIDDLNDNIFKFAPNQPGLVLMYADSAIQLSIKINDSVRIANSITRKGVVLYYLGDYNGSLEQYFNAIKIKEKIGLTNTLWREYNNIGLILRNQNLFEEALKYFNLAMNLIDKNDKKFVASIWNNIGITYRSLKEYDLAKNAIEKALELNSEIDEKQSIAHNFNNLGIILYFQKNYNPAIDYFNKALPINRQLFNRFEESQNLYNLATVYLEMKEYKKAYGYIQESEQIINEIKSESLKVEHLKIKTKYYTEIKDFKKALELNKILFAILDSLNTSDKLKQYDQFKTISNIEKEIQQIDFLKHINTIQKERIQIQHFVEIGGGIFILIILLLMTILFRNLKINKRLNASLKEHSHEMTSLNEELKSANDELRLQHEELETTLDSLKQTQDKLIQSEKMASLGILSAGVAHEINNPLNFIQGGLVGIEKQLFNEPNENASNLKSYLTMIKEGVIRAADIVNELNQYTSRENLPFEHCNIHSLIDSCLSILTNDSDKVIYIEKKYSDHCILIECNENKIHRAISNILVNAAQSFNVSGTIAISTKIEKDFIILTIMDNGCGIKKEDLPKIFDPFFTTKDPGKGTGLGLSTTYNIIKEHQGSVMVESEYEIGTTVTIKLPVYKD